MYMTISLDLNLDTLLSPIRFKSVGKKKKKAVGRQRNLGLIILVSCNCYCKTTAAINEAGNVYPSGKLQFTDGLSRVRVP
jgi:hypothetical protein